MAKTAKSHHGLTKPLKKQQQQKAIPAKGSKKVAGAAKTTTKVTAKKLAVAPPTEAKKEAVVAKPAGKPTPVVGDPKKGPGNMFARPQMRRGRRPKALADYKPNSDEEENREEEVDYKGLEYDTGIRVAKPRDDNPFNMDRFDDYDEELNFDF